MNQEVKKWVDMAEMDYGVAKHLFETYYPKPYEIICYHCQQSAEKIIKGIIIANGSQGGIPKSHDLSFLMNQIKNKVSIQEEFYDYADELTPYGVVVRYPSELFLEERHVKEALKMANELIEWGKKIIGSL